MRVSKARWKIGRRHRAIKRDAEQVCFPGRCCFASGEKSSMTKLIIFGLGDFANLVRHYFATDSQCEVVCFCADREFIKSGTIDGLPVIAFDEINDKYPCDEYSMFVAAGYSNMRTRKNMFDRARANGYSFVNYVSSSAIIDPTAKIGVNNLVLQASVIEPFCEIGDNNVVWSSVTLSHNVQLGSHCFLASNVTVGGFSTICDNSFLGFSATVLQHIRVARESLVAANSLVNRDTEPYSRNMGSPALCVGFHKRTGIQIR